MDGSHETSGGKEVGDAWMRAIVDQCHKEGVPVVFDDLPTIFPDAFPMSDCALYYGWYAGNIAGPFNQPGFKFVPGAIAAHIHSYSAATLRDENSGWAGPLVSRGAAATVGNVYEPLSRADRASRYSQRSLAARLHLCRKRIHVVAGALLDGSGGGRSTLSSLSKLDARSTRKLRRNPPPDGAPIMISRSRTATWSLPIIALRPGLLPVAPATPPCWRTLD